MGRARHTLQFGGTSDKYDRESEDKSGFRGTLGLFFFYKSAYCYFWCKIFIPLIENEQRLGQ